MDEEKRVEEESRGLTFKDILFIIRKHWIAIVAFILVGAAGGFIWSRVEAPTYRSTGTMLVSYEGTNTTITQEYQFASYITNTYVTFVKERVVLSAAAEKLDVLAESGEITRKVTAGELSKNLSVSADSLILKVSYVAGDAKDAKVIVQTIIDTASEVADSVQTDDQGNPVLDDKGNTKPVYKFLNGNLTPVSPAKEGTKVSHTMRNTAIGLGAGIVLALGYVVIRELADNTFKSSEEIERVLNLPVLAGIPDYHFDDEKKGGK